MSHLAKIISAAVRPLPWPSKRRIFASTLSLLLVSTTLSICQALPSEAKDDKADPKGTLLLPLVPKLAEPEPDESPNKAPLDNKFSTPIHESLEYDINSIKPPGGQPGESAGFPQPEGAEKAKTDRLRPEPTKISPELGNVDESSLKIDEDTTLKGTIQIVADDTEYDQQKNTFLGTGNAVAIIAGQNSKLEADMILYDQNAELIDARGNVRIFRDGQLTTGSAFKFKVNSDEYLITNPDTEVNGTAIVARKAYGVNDGITFKNGTMTLPKPIVYGSTTGYAPLNYQDELWEKRAHPEAYVPEDASFKFTAKKMVYEKYLDHDNLTIFGGRMQFGQLGIPLPKFKATIGQENNITFPISPYMGNNLMSGGLNLGPNFHQGIGKYGVLSYAPLIQLGGRSLSGSTTKNSSLPGLGTQVSYRGPRLSAHLAYGSNSNLLIGDLKYKINNQTRYQGGINRYLEDGLFGYRRARILSEFVDVRSTGKIPFLSNLSLRSSAGWAEDNPQLINLTPQYAKLFSKPASSKIVSGYRLSESISASTHPLFKLGNEKYGVTSNISGGLAFKAYSTGDTMAMAQIGPNFEAVADRFKVRVGYTQSAIRGQSPFVFDQFIQGTRSAYISSGYKVSKYLTLGGSVGYNFIQKLAYTRTLTAAIGPQDCKLLLSRDFLTGNQRMGFDLLMGNPINFNRLVLKNSPDAGKLGGI